MRRKKHPSRTFADISDYQGRFDAHAYASAGHRLVAIKAGEGLGHGGASHYAERVRAAHHAGLHVLHYWFAHPEEGPRAQMEEFWRTVAPHWRTGDRLVIDLETGDPRHGHGWFSEADRDLVDVSRGHHAILYTYRSYFDEAGGIHPLSNAVWIAGYDGTLSLPRLGRGLITWAKQYTDGLVGAEPHRFAGIGVCDGSVINARTLRRL